MKRLPSFVILFLLLINSVRSQVITITFEATLNGAPTPLDSILVMNLTQGGDTVLYAPDTVLVLDISTAIQSHGVEPVGAFEFRAPHPNPFDDGARLSVMVPDEGMLELTVLDARGTELATIRRIVRAGDHRFRFVGGPAGVLHAVAVWKGERRSQRLVCVPAAVRDVELQYTGSVQGQGGGGPKSGTFLWQPGDSLRYLGYASDTIGPLSAFIEATPVSSEDETFVLAHGLVCPDSPMVTDIDGNLYATVQIGSQCWMAQNLNTTHYRDGSAIPNVLLDTVWTQQNSAAWSDLDNNAANAAIYGKLYNWYAAANPNICPQGWHMPTDAEWQQLEASLGMPAGELGLSSFRGINQNVGGKMKTTTLWNSPNSGANNQSGFAGLASGYRSWFGGYFDSLGNNGFWWTASEDWGNFAWYRFLVNNNSGILRLNSSKVGGYCLRCVRD